MTTVRIAAGQPYDVFIGSGLLAACGALAAQVHEPCNLALVSDSGIPQKWIDKAAASLGEAGFSVTPITFEQGEDHKNMTTVAALLEAFSAIPLTRGDLVAALGGGITGDAAGFASACYLRGIPFLQIPTTLLAAVDSSVGGKTGVNLAAGKNLAGAFHQPLRVLCDLDIISTLPEELWIDGAAECVKCGLLSDPELFELLAAGGLKSRPEEVVRRCVELKSRLVAEDERDTGSRQLLNLGHTLGHAIERASGFGVSHGRGVAMGMVLITRAAAELGFCKADCLPRLLAALEACGLPTQCPYGRGQLLEAALRDKKRRGGSITLAVPHDVGDTRLHTIPVEELPRWIDAGLGGQEI